MVDIKCADQEDLMNVPISKARAQWHELIRRAENSEEITLTHSGRAVAQLSQLSGLSKHLPEADDRNAK